jgi:hypothetical protein
MKKNDQSAKATIKRWLRFGQMVDHFIDKDFELVFRAKDGGEVDPFDKGGPKMAPIPDSPHFNLSDPHDNDYGTDNG